MIGTQPTGRIAGVTVTAKTHGGVRVLVNGKPAHVTILDDSGNVVAAGIDVADEIEAMAVNSYRDFLTDPNRLKVCDSPPGLHRIA